MKKKILIGIGIVVAIILILLAVYGLVLFNNISKYNKIIALEEEAHKKIDEYNYKMTTISQQYVYDSLNELERKKSATDKVEADCQEIKTIFYSNNDAFINETFKNNEFDGISYMNVDKESNIMHETSMNVNNTSNVQYALKFVTEYPYENYLPLISIYRYTNQLILNNSYNIFLYSIKENEDYYIYKRKYENGFDILYINKATGLVDASEYTRNDWYGGDGKNHKITTYQKNEFEVNSNYFDLEKIFNNQCDLNFTETVDTPLFDGESFYEAVNGLSRIIDTRSINDSRDVFENNVIIDILNNIYDENEISKLVMDIRTIYNNADDMTGIVNRTEVKTLLAKVLGAIDNEDIDIKDKIILSESLKRVDCLSEIEDEVLLNIINQYSNMKYGKYFEQS